MRFGRLAGAAIAFAIAAFVCLVVVAAPSLLAAGRDLREARAALTRGGTAAAQGRLADAAGAFDRARDFLQQADQDLGSLPVRLLSMTPFAGRNVDVANAVTDAAVSVTDAAVRLTSTLEGLPGGMSALAPQDGRFAVDRFRLVGAALGDAADLVADADASLRAAPASLVLPPIARARSDSMRDTERLLRSMTAAATISAGFPAFLGDASPRTYLVVAENPAELRGTGGLFGAYALVTFDDGAYRLTRFRPIQQVPRPSPSDVPPPPPGYEALYGPARKGDGNGYWLNINMTPDFPTAAKVLESSFEAARGIELAGVLAVDPFALQSIAELGGPIDSDELGTVIAPGDVVEVLSNTAYEEIHDPAKRKSVLGGVAESILDRLLAGGLGGDVVRVLLDTTADGHLSVYVDDPAMEDALSSTATGGAFAPGAGDLVGVIQNNASSNKVDYYLTRTVSYEIWLRPDGATETHATIDLTNAAPSTGEPRYILGPGEGVDASAGDNVSLVNVYCVRCQLTGAEHEGEVDTLTSAEELGATFFQQRVLIPSDGTAQLRLSWLSTGGWHGSGAGGTYDLRVAGQTLIHEQDVHVTIHLPPGTRVTHMTDGMTASGSTAEWRASPTRIVDLEVAFDSPFPLDIWRHLVDALS